jgi:hypothetical protein
MDYAQDLSESLKQRISWNKLDLKFEFTSNDLVFEYQSKIVILQSKPRFYHYCLMFQIDIDT